jgi:nicotinate-nucleotide adenylyltransferase
MSAPRKVALFGGTFDPVHLGHLHLAALAKDSLGLDEVRFLPCQISPHKLGSSPASATDRLEMLRLATAGLPWAVVDDFELHRQGPSYSYQTAEAMAARFPEARLFWIMGSDQWDALADWKAPEILAELCEFVVLTRGQAPQARSGYRLHAISEEHPASATDIRKAISEGRLPPAWLHPQVARWIAEYRLYR